MEFIGNVLIFVLIIVLLVLLVIVLRGSKRSSRKGLLSKVSDGVEKAKKYFALTKPMPKMRASVFCDDKCIMKKDIEVDRHHPEFTIGRADTCTLHFKDDYMSRKNAIITCNDNEELVLNYYEKDKKIYFINDEGKIEKLIDSKIITDGLQIYLGKSLIKFETVNYFEKFENNQVEQEVKQEEKARGSGTISFSLPKRNNQKEVNQNGGSSKVDVDEFDA